MSKMDESMGLPEVPKNIEENLPDNIPGDDYEEIRSNLISLMNKITNSEILDDAIDVANQTQKAGNIMAVSNLIKSLVDANRALMELNAKRDEIKTPDANAAKEKNILMIGTTADLQRIVKEARRKNQEIVIEHEP